jgi:hypothetical protein
MHDHGEDEPMTLPRFPDFKTVDLSDRALIQSYLDRCPSDISEMNFGNIFIWRNYDHPGMTDIHGNLCLRFESPDEPAYFLQPIGECRIPETIDTCLTSAPRLSRVSAAFAEKYCSFGFECDCDRNNYDYVYLASDLVELKGKKYDGKRNRIKKFEKSHAYRYLPLESEHLGECRRLFEVWFEEKSEVNKMIGAQKDAIQQALTHYEALGLTGGAIEVEGRIAAFSIAERLNADTAVIHIEIISPHYDGLSQLMNRELVKNGLAGYTYINREQDMGLAGLRQAKLSYQPHHMVEKHHIWK